MVDILAALRSRTEQAELISVSSESTELSFEANEMKSATVEETRGQAIRVIAEGRLGFAAAAGPASDEELVENALTSACFGDQVSFQLPASAVGAAVNVYDPGLAEVPIAQLVELGREIVGTLLDIDHDAHISVDIERSVDQFRLRNSAGAEVDERSSSFSLGISVERVRGDDVFMAYEDVYGIGLDDSYRQAIRRLSEKMKLAKRSASLLSGELPVLFSPSGALVLLYPILLGINGQNVQRRISPLSDQIGDKVFDSQLSIWDDPMIPGRPASGSYDDEGVLCHRQALISEGICHGFVYDLRTAALMNTQSTGNAERDLFSMPTPSPSNLIVSPGTQSIERILAGIDHGLYVDDVLGLGQGNAISGAYSNSVGLAYVVEHGEIVGRVKDVSIAGNIYQDLQNIAAMSHETEWVHGSNNFPYILLPKVKVVCQD